MRMCGLLLKEMNFLHEVFPPWEINMCHISVGIEIDRLIIPLFVREGLNFQMFRSHGDNTYCAAFTLNTAICNLNDLYE